MKLMSRFEKRKKNREEGKVDENYLRGAHNPVVAGD
jgi:hypothetical protein